MGPAGSLFPSFSVTISSGLRSSTPYPTAAKSLITSAASIPNFFASAGPSTTHERLVMSHRSSATGPATAKHAAVTSEASTPLSS